MKIIHRIMAAPVVAVALLLASGLSADFAIHALTDRFDLLRDHKLKLAQTVGDMKTRMATLNSRLYHTILLMESLPPDRVAASRREIETETAALEKQFAALADPNDAELTERLAKLPAAMSRYRNKALQAFSMAEGSPGGGAMMLAAAERSFGEAFAILQALSAKADAQVQTMSQQVDALSRRASMILYATTLFAILASLATAAWSSRYVVRRLDRAVRISEAVARGELDVELPAVEADELGRLLQSLAQTAQRLSASIRAIQLAATSIDSAANEISAGSLNLSNRTEHAASGLELTTSAMREMEQLLSGGGSAAQDAHQLVDNANAVAGRGGAVVAEVVATMQGINQGSSRIAEITGVIDGIAFQTNILALNAAVEAARAGEQGRGFAVVAGEVRALAQRCAQAAKEIKSLIGASVTQTEHGAKLVGQAGGAMGEIVTAVARVQQTIAQLTQMTQQQNTSLGGVSQTLSRFDQMMQENAALAEQSAAASESLRRQSCALTEVVGQFRLPAHA